MIAAGLPNDACPNIEVVVTLSVLAAITEFEGLILSEHWGTRDVMSEGTEWIEVGREKVRVTHVVGHIVPAGVNPGRSQPTWARRISILVGAKDISYLETVWDICCALRIGTKHR
jgi:hypothetical protein